MVRPCQFHFISTGDLLDDANFSRDTVNAAILQLFVEEEWIRWILQERKEGKLRKPSDPASSAAEYFDQAFENQVNRLVEGAKEQFLKMAFRDGMQFCWYKLLIARDQYRDWAKVTGGSLREDLVINYIEMLAVILSPICPHWCEHVWELLEKPGLVVNARWPEAKPYNRILARSYEFLQDTLRIFRLAVIKSKKGEKKGYGFIADTYTEWQKGVLVACQQALDSNGGRELPANIMDILKKKVMSDDALKPFAKNSLQFGAAIRDDFKERGAEALELTLPFDQKGIILDNMDYILKNVGLEELSVYNLSEPNLPAEAKKKQNVLPGKPEIALYL